jgi:hypothetical protein
VAGAEQVQDVAQGLAFARPDEALEGGVGGEPLVVHVLLAERDRIAAPDERGEDHRQLDGRELVKIERLHDDVVQPLDGEAGLFPDLADRGLLRGFARLDAAVHGLPCGGTSRAE